MKFRVNWSIQQDQWLPVYKRWSSMSPQERANEFPEGGKLLGRWHDMAGRTGILIIRIERPCHRAPLARPVEPPIWTSILRPSSMIEELAAGVCSICARMSLLPTQLPSQA